MFMFKQSPLKKKNRVRRTFLHETTKAEINMQMPTRRFFKSNALYCIFPSRRMAEFPSRTSPQTTWNFFAFHTFYKNWNHPNIPYIMDVSVSFFLHDNPSRSQCVACKRITEAVNYPGARRRVTTTVAGVRCTSDSVKWLRVSAINSQLCWFDYRHTSVLHLDNLV